jgi:hypothetical protein
MRGEIYALQNEHAAALSDFTRAIELQTWQRSLVWLHARRIKVHLDLKHYEQELADVAKAVELAKAVGFTLDDPYPRDWILCILENVASCPDEKFRAGMRALADKTVQIRKGKPDASDDAKAYDIRAAIYVATGTPDEADRLSRDLLHRLRKKDAPKSAATAAWLAMLGNVLLKQQQYVAAEPFLRESLSIREQALPDHWLRYNALSLLGGALLGQKKYAAAEPLLLQGYEGMKQREAQIPLSGGTYLFVEATERLSRLYEATNQPEGVPTGSPGFAGGGGICIVSQASATVHLSSFTVANTHTNFDYLVEPFELQLIGEVLQDLVDRAPALEQVEDQAHDLAGLLVRVEDQFPGGQADITDRRMAEEFSPSGLVEAALIEPATQGMQLCLAHGTFETKQ